MHERGVCYMNDRRRILVISLFCTAFLLPIVAGKRFDKHFYYRNKIKELDSDKDVVTYVGTAHIVPTVKKASRIFYASDDEDRPSWASWCQRLGLIDWDPMRTGVVPVLIFKSNDPETLEIPHEVQDCPLLPIYFFDSDGTISFTFYPEYGEPYKLSLEILEAVSKEFEKNTLYDAYYFRTIFKEEKKTLEYGNLHEENESWMFDEETFLFNQSFDDQLIDYEEGYQALPQDDDEILEDSGSDDER